MMKVKQRRLIETKLLHFELNVVLNYKLVDVHKATIFG